MEIGYKSRELSTADFLDDFDPPLVFMVKRRSSEGWLDLIDDLNSDVPDTALALRIMTGICYGVTDGTEKSTVPEFFEGLQKAAPEMADELFCDLTYALGIEFLRDQRRRIAALKKTLPTSNGSEPDPSPALESSAS